MFTSVTGKVGTKQGIFNEGFKTWTLIKRSVHSLLHSSAGKFPRPGVKRDLDTTLPVTEVDIRGEFREIMRYGMHQQHDDKATEAEV